MHENKNDAPTSKVFYRPIEASIRWAGLLRYEQVILASISSPRRLPQSLDCPRCDELRLCTERIFDGILNGELPFGRNGITTRDSALIDSPDLTVRHVDLKRWMRQHYPGHCCKVSDEAAFCLIQRPYVSKTLLTRRISPRGSP
ncbi:hypothetical protein [Pseudomonas aeruginosa]|uniref:hypothetical protein n=1 Tax=Pseudomonas aeruginosa TaxID=287 RepID=UPI003D80A8B4